MSNKLFAEFFAGIGLVHAGLATTGWKCEYANDIDTNKHQMYQHMFGESPYYHVGDIWNTNEVVIRIEKQIKLATASFPCVDLSVAGNRKGLAGKESGTFFGFIEVLRQLHSQNKEPSMILVENVMGFLTAHDGNDFNKACELLGDLGYWLDCFIVDAKYFTPQSRPRLFIVGCKQHAIPANAYKKSRNDDSTDWLNFIIAQTDIRVPKLVERLAKSNIPTGFFALPVPVLPNVNKGIDTVIDKVNGEWWPTEKITKHIDEMSESHRKTIKLLSQNNFLTSGTMYRRVRDGKSRTEIRTDGLAGCLRTPRGGSSKQMIFVAGDNQIKMRWMEPIEYASLQGIPDFPIKVGKTQALFGFGDAVCVPAIAWITKHYLEPIYLEL
jgi:DNA (cytosine-5)-methyltransferase 1